MSVTVESLELEVRASSHAAVSGLDALSASLTRLKTAAHGGLGLRAVTAQLGSLNGALGALNGRQARRSCGQPAKALRVRKPEAVLHRRHSNSKYRRCRPDP